MSEHLRFLSQHATVPLSVMPNAGLPSSASSGAEYPLQPASWPTRSSEFVRRTASAWSAGCCGTTRSTCARSSTASAAARSPRTPQVEPSAASLYSAVPFRQDAGVLHGRRATNTNGSKAFREAMLAGDWEKVVDIGREAVREGAHLIDLCVDYVGRDGASTCATPLAAGHRLHAADHARLDRAAGDRGRAWSASAARVINSVNFEDGEGPTAASPR
jgi:5-methyltetrahydrofolate--homocysteine methyltransferase